MGPLTSLFGIHSVLGIALVAFAVVLLAILVVSFRSRPIVFCQYLKAMTGVALKPPIVKRVFSERGQDGVRELFLDLIIKEDLKTGPLQIPDRIKKETKQT